MSTFARLAHEAADNQDDEQTVAPEAESATTEIADAQAEAGEVAQEDADNEALIGEQEELEQAEEIVEEAQEGHGLSPDAARFLQNTMSRIIGKRAAARAVAQENFEGGRSAQREATRNALESIRETLKQFWEAIKKALKKFYAKVKTYLVKAFSGAKKLKERAERLQEKASNTVGTIEDKTFSFGQCKAIATDGKYADINSVTGGLTAVETFMKGLVKVEKADKFDSVLDEAVTLAESAIKAAKTSSGASVTGGDAVVTKLKAIQGGSDLSFSDDVEDKLGKMYTSEDASITAKMSAKMPGGKAVFSITVAGAVDTSTPKEFAKAIKNTRLVLGNDKYTPRDISDGDVKTLSTSQIDKVCDSVIEIAETAYTYQKAWERRDKFQAKLERDIDSIVKDVNSDKEEDNRLQSDVRKFADALPAAVRRRTSFESQFISYALTTGSAFLNYAERSLAQYKAK